MSSSTHHKAQRQSGTGFVRAASAAGFTMQ
jgi:hypothetical protein